MSTIQVDYNELKEKVDAGWKRPQLAEHFGLKDSQMAKCLKDCGLKIRKFHKPAYQVVGMPGDNVGPGPDITQPSVGVDALSTTDEVENTEENDTEEVSTDNAAPTWDA